MRLLDIVNGPWAITIPMFDEIQAIYGSHLRGDKIDLQQLSAKTGLALNNQPKGYQVQDGVAVLPVDGVIAKRANLFTKISGGTSSELVGRDFVAAMQDRTVSAVLLAIDSPGGTVDGTPELADLIRSYRGTKPIVAHTDGMMASAAYWIGSSADRVLLSSEVVTIGSIGVVGKHIDVSAAESKQGIKTTDIYAGKYKRIASQYAPLTEEGRAYLQEAVEHAYSVFVEAVATNRGASIETVIGSMADGRIFHGSKAIDAGLADGVATLAEAIAMARDMARSPQSTRRAGAARATAEDTSMDLATLKAEHPELVEAIVAEATSGLPEQLAQARAAGAQAERDRIADVRGQLVPGHEAMIEQMAFDGVSTGSDAARAIVAAERDLRTAESRRIEQEANQAMPAAITTGDGPRTIKRAEFDALPPSQKAEARKQFTIID